MQDFVVGLNGVNVPHECFRSNISQRFDAEMNPMMRKFMGG